jgi:hypothetical protein
VVFTLNHTVDLTYFAEVTRIVGVAIVVIFVKPQCVWLMKTNLKLNLIMKPGASVSCL